MKLTRTWSRILNVEQRVWGEQGLGRTDVSTFRQGQRLRHRRELGDVRGYTAQGLFRFRERDAMRNDARWRRGRGYAPGENTTEAGQRHGRRERLSARHFRARPETLHRGALGNSPASPGESYCFVNNLAALSCQIFSRMQSVANESNRTATGRERGGARVALHRRMRETFCTRPGIS